MTNIAKLHSLLRFINKQVDPAQVKHEIEYIQENYCIEIRFFRTNDSMMSQNFIQFNMLDYNIYLWSDMTESYEEYSLEQIKTIIKTLY